MIQTVLITIFCYEIFRFTILQILKRIAKRKREKENIQKFYEEISNPAMRELIDEPWIYEMQRAMLAEGVKAKNKPPQQ